MKKVKMFLFILVITFAVIMNTFASNINQVKMCTITNEYKDWLSLSDDEKSSAIMPSLCKIENNITERALPCPGINTPNYLFTGDTDYTIYDYYNSKDEGYTTSVKNQEETGLCWAFAMNATLESYMKASYEATYDLSERHIDQVDSYSTFNVLSPEGTYGRFTDDGGNEYMATNYYLNGYGPINETDMPFDDYSSYTTDQLLSRERKVNVKGMAFYNDTAVGGCSEEATQEIKQAIGYYGGSFASLYIESETYNFDTGASYYDGASSKNINHSIELVGWDNNYSLDNFKSTKKPVGNGAWIAKNSWGEDFGKSGYIYISYYDTNICKNIAYVTEANSSINDKTYYNDYAGYGGAFLTTLTDNMMIAEKFTRTHTEYEKVKDINFTIGKDVNYSVYINPNNDSFDDEDLVLIGSGTSDYFGYQTIDASSLGIYLTGNKYAIVIKEDNATGEYDIPIQIKYGDIYTAEGKVNTSFLYDSELSIWDDLTLIADYGDLYKPSLNIKVSTNNIIRSYHSLEFKDNNIYMMPSTLNDFKTKLTLDNSVNLVYSESTIEANPILKTGYNIKLDNKYTYNIIIIGDASGDGQIKINDVAKLNDYLLGNNNMTSYQLSAIDLTRDNQIKINDITKLNDYMLGNISVLSTTLSSSN